MIGFLEAVILGLIQGLTEFLPVSSSGHLALAQQIIGLKEAPLLFDVQLHVATLLATLVILRKAIWELIRSVPRMPVFCRNIFQKGHLAIGDDPEVWTVVLIGFSTMITGTMGILFYDFFEKAFASKWVLPITFFFTGALLFSTRWVKAIEDRSPQKRKLAEGKKATQATIKDSLWIGFAQGLAILPGLSRSGMTISTALIRGFSRNFAGEYAFLVSLPAILGALILELGKSDPNVSVPVDAMLAGCGMAFLSGAVSLHYLLKWIRAGKLSYFAFYVWLMALVSVGTAYYL